MKRIALVFIIAILIPALLLAVLAVRSLRVQEMVVSSQRAQLHQSTCDAMAANINLFMDDVRIFFGQMVDELVEERGQDVIGSFDQLIGERWSQAAVGSVVSDDGQICSPVTATGNEWAAPFLQNHSDFLSNRRVVEVYQAPKVLYGQVEVTEDRGGQDKSSSLGSMKWLGRGGGVEDVEASQEKFAPSAELAVPAAASIQPLESGKLKEVAEESQVRLKVAASNSKLQDYRFENSAAQRQSLPAPQAAAPAQVQEELAQNGQMSRNVEPSQQMAEGGFGYSRAQRNEASSDLVNVDNFSRLNLAEMTQNDLTAEEEEGAVSRIIDGELHTLLWKRHSLLPGYTFWVELNQEEIRSDLAGLFADRSLVGASPEVSLALLGSQGELVTQTQARFEADWSTPFVAAEVGQILPRWEVAAYLLDPDALSASAKTVLITLSLTIVTLVGAVAVGSWLILRSVNYEMQMAARKTDFVSNVSHELKTPLTSIRMFSELLEGAEEYDTEQTRKYSGVISKESARLTRLIDRLLDFSRLDRDEMKLREEEVDLAELVRETVDNYRLQIEAEGLEVKLSIVSNDPVLTHGDRDALSQVLLNLLTNAEKYAAGGGEVCVSLGTPSDGMVRLLVQDRGPGISKQHQRRIFEKFYRADESISSGIEGSGIGLALCRQIVERHHGQIRYLKRDGGGSTFAINLPTTLES